MRLVFLNSIEETPETDDKKDALVLANPEGNIELSHVNFSYTTEKRLIEDFNLNVKKDSCIGDCRTYRVRKDNNY